MGGKGWKMNEHEKLGIRHSWDTWDTFPMSEQKCPLCGNPIEKHVIQEGSRFHVHWYNGKGKHCSTRDCEDNHGVGKCVPCQTQ
jgi:hypothetical protein